MRIFVQGENVEIRVIEVEEAIQLRGILLKVADFGFPLPEVIEDVWIGLEDKEQRLSLNEWIRIEVGGEEAKIHFHRCHKISVTCMFNGKSIFKDFAPSATTQTVKDWVTSPDGFDLEPVDAADHVLKICDREDRPLPSQHIGIWVHHPNCGLCLELVPADRHQG